VTGFKIGICGCGWLGTSLAKQLLAAGHHVVGTKRDAADARALSETLGCDVVPFDVMKPDYTSAASLLGCDIVVINIAAGRRDVDFNAYQAAMTAFIDTLFAAEVKHVLFISTTSVYGDLKGQVTEHSTPVPQTASGQAHHAIEAHLRAHYGDTSTVLRLAGLIGGDRHPSKTLAGRSDLAGANEPVNLVHRADVISTIAAIVHQQQWGNTFHLCAELHPPKATYYPWAAREMGLTPPQFTVSAGDGKWIDASETLKALGLTLRYGSPYQMIANGAVSPD